MKRQILILGLMAAVVMVFTLTADACPQGCCGQGCGGMGNGPRFEAGPHGPGPRAGGNFDGPRQGRGRRAAGRDGARLYNPATERTVDGEVVRVEVAPGKRGPRGVIAWMKSGDEFLPVHLGPAWFLKDENMKVEKGDRLIVLGSEISERGGPALIAREFKKQDHLLTLRDDEGVPKWSRRQQRGE